MPATPYVIVIGDGDKVGDRLDSLLFAEELDSLKQLSSAISRAVTALAEEAVLKMGGEVVVAGGDDVLLKLPAERFDASVLEQLRTTFQRATGCTLSIGAGFDVERAYLNLRRAKARGGDAIVLP